MFSDINHGDFAGHVATRKKLRKFGPADFVLASSIYKRLDAVYLRSSHPALVLSVHEGTDGQPKLFLFVTLHAKLSKAP